MTGLRWALALILAAFFFFMGAQKFGTENLIFDTIATKSGISLFEPQIRVMIGVVEILAGLLLVSPKMRQNGARIALLLLIGAIGFHLSPWLGISVGEMGKSIFFMALGGLILTCAVLAVERAAKAPFISS